MWDCCHFDKMADASDETSEVSKRLMNLSGVDVNYDNLVDFKFLVGLELQGGRKTFDFCMKLGLIGDRYECPKCGKNMTLSERKDIRDGFEWRCACEHGVRRSRSVRRGSWFSKSGLDMNAVLQIVWLWVWKCSSELIVEVTKCSAPTVSDWKKYCQEICLQLMLEECEAIGGPGVTVDLEQSKFGKRKLNRGQSVDGKWILGGIERGTGKCFLTVVPDRSCASLVNILENYVLPDSTVVSDCWSSYDCHDPYFLRLQFDHGLSIQEPEPGSHTNSTWSAVKRGRPTHSAKDSLVYYLAEYMWRKKLKGGNKFMHFIDAVIKVYPPLCRDEDQD